MEVLAELQRRLNLPETGADPADFDPPPVQDSDGNTQPLPWSNSLWTQLAMKIRLRIAP